MAKKTICVYGAASNRIGSVFLEETRQLGAEIAKRGYDMIYGGGGSGVMGACAKGASEADGVVIGVVPFFMEDYEDINHDCTEIIHTQTMGERKQIMEDNADAFIVAPGGIGTFDEFFQILTLIDLERRKTPLILFNPEGYYDPLLDFINSCVERGFIRDRVPGLYTVCRQPKEALDALEAALPRH